MNIEIKNREGVIIFAGDYESVKQACEQNADLAGAYLGGANLRSANLAGAYLAGANLENAYLEGAYLRSANLRSAYLEGANLRSANLENAYLEYANLRSADLEYADLEYADLRSADLEYANLAGAKGVIQFGPCPGSGRIGLAVLHPDCVMVKLGCFWDTAEKAIEAVAAKYVDLPAERGAYTGLIKAAVAALELQRVAKGGAES